MKKVVISLCLSIMILLIGSINEVNILGDNTKAKITKDDSIFSKMKLELSRFPKKYPSDAAVEDGCFVVVHGALKSKKSIMDTFVTKTKIGKTASIILVCYTKEGDALITKVIYSNHKYFGVEDDTRDAYASPKSRKYYDFQYKYLLVSEEEKMTNYYLVNDKKLTAKVIQRSMYSNNSKNFVDFKYLCMYNN